MDNANLFKSQIIKQGINQDFYRSNIMSTKNCFLEARQETKQGVPLN